ncbi:MAG TPA: glycosyltransferase family 9 protein, partial [Blastocatellia bacterium]|nr:glycosyltransferase family 9 protein [Blastocatellia bacterium]
MIRVPNWVGDAVMAEPSLRELRRIFSEARITLVARPWVAGLFDGEGLADEVIPLHDARGFVQTAGHFLSGARRLRRERFDFAVLLQNAFGAALLARAAGARTVAGYPTDGRRALLDYVIPLEPGHNTAHQVRYYLNIAARLEQRLKGESRVEIETAQPRLRATDEAKERAARMLEVRGMTRSPIVAI